MNQLRGIIAAIENDSDMSLVDVKVDGDLFGALVLETPQSAAYLKPETPVVLVFKETEVALAKNLSGDISLRNRAKAVVSGLVQGTVLTKVDLQYGPHRIVSIISTRSARRLNLKKGEELEWLVKANEMTLKPV